LGAGATITVAFAPQTLGLEPEKTSPRRGLLVNLCGQRVMQERRGLSPSAFCANYLVAELPRFLTWLGRQKHIERKLAARHLAEDSLVLYDVTGSYYEGRSCPLARFGHNRERKRGKLIIVYGLLTDGQGRPVSVQVYPGNTGDPSTLPEQVHKLRERFGLRRIVLVGDRGMLTETQLDKVKEHPGLGWISALRTQAIRKLVDGGHLQMSLFDQQDLAEIYAPAFSGERLVACYNPILAHERWDKREKLLAATEKELEKIAREVLRRTKKPLGKVEIAKKVGKVINRYKVAKHFKLDIAEGSFSFSRKESSILLESQLDGIYVIRTREPADRLSAEDTVRSYKRLSQVERLIRSMKTVDLLVRPIHHRTEARVRAHIFLCMLAYYVEVHMRNALAPLLFDDEELEGQRDRRDPVKPAKPSASARKKKARLTTSDGLPVQSFHSLMSHLATRCRNYCKVKDDRSGFSFQQLTEMTPLQERAFQLLACSQ